MYAFIIASILTAGTPEVIEQHATGATDSTAQYIMTLKPKMNVRRAQKLGAQIDFWASHYQVDAKLMVAIIRQESDFRPIKACWPAPWKGEGEITCDHGIAQINQTWVERWALDADKLVTDEAYNIQAQARVLAWLKRYFGDEDAWFGRYHSATPSKRRSYQEKIESLLVLR
jgi:hypothetical protein